MRILRINVLLIILCFASEPLLSSVSANHRRPTSTSDASDYLSSSRGLHSRYFSSNASCTSSLPLNRRPRDVSGACVLPPYPRQGTYVVSGLPKAKPGESYESFKLTVACRRGYGFMEQDGSGSTGPRHVFCSKGEWSEYVPECVRFCRLDPDPSVEYTCHVPGAGFKVCDGYVPPGTRVKPVCNSPIYYSTDGLRYMWCTSGYWDYTAKCKAECGRVTPKAEQLVIGGDKAKRGELPWHAGIYLKTAVPYLQICGGSLVSVKVVISAAHCFWHDKKGKLPAQDFAIAIGKVYRPWSTPRDFTAQTSDVKEIRIPRLFQGQAANLQEDIAVLILSTTIVYQTYVRPVCLNFDPTYEKWQLQHGKLGKTVAVMNAAHLMLSGNRLRCHLSQLILKGPEPGGPPPLISVVQVAGWGLTETDGKASPVLKSVNMPYINEDICINTLPPSFREYITGDKFCAGYTNGTALCKGDSGGGLAFSDKEFGIDRFYLRGVVSAVPNDEEKLCNDMTYTTFTKISKHEEFIKEALAASRNKTCPPNVFRCADGSCKDQGVDCNGRKDCADGSDESDELCVPVTTPPDHHSTVSDSELYGILEQVFGPETPVPSSQTSPTNSTIKNQGCEPVAHNFTSKKTGQISFDKCIEYQEKYVYRCISKSKRTPYRNYECMHNKRELILGGHSSSPGDHTHRVTLGYKLLYNNIQWALPGAIISEKFVLSAATAVTRQNKYELAFILTGSLTLDSREKKYYTYQIKKIYVHPDFQPAQNYNDIALVEAEKPFVLSSVLVPACLHTPTSSVDMEQVSPWTLEWHKQTDLFLKIPLQRMTDLSCTSKFPSPELPEGFKLDKQICYEDVKTSNETCVGDVGGTVETENPDVHCMYLLLGVASIIQCKVDPLRDYAVFTRISPYIQWIESVVWPS